MPEGPEVTITVQYLKSKLKNKYITSYKVLSGRYTKNEIKGKEYFKRKTYRIVDIDSRGKLIWFTLQEKGKKNKIYMTSTLGLTGMWGFFKNKSSRIKFNIVTRRKKKYNLYYSDQVNYGEIRFYDDKNELDTRIKTLAPDILKDSLSTQDIINRINDLVKNSRKNLNLVKILMDQKTLVSGIGNYLVAEILYHAKLNPHRSLKELSKKEIKHLAYSMRYITKTSYYDNKTGYMKNYLEFMKEHPEKIDKRIFPNYHPDIKTNNKEFVFNVYKQKYDTKGNKVKVDNIIKSRKIHWIPSIQI